MSTANFFKGMLRYIHFLSKILAKDLFIIAFRFKRSNSSQYLPTVITGHSNWSNFRREPIYLPDDSLTLQPRYHRHAIACRKIPELRRLRASFLGRAIHTSLAAWQKQVDNFLKQS